MNERREAQRTIGLFGATGVGVGAIVGGGILALAGVAFAATGPAALLAFALNGVIALLTAWSFARLASRFPESGGCYTFAKKVMSIETAFVIGWIVWFASIVAGVLYAFGFGAFLVLAIDGVYQARSMAPPSWLADHRLVTLFAAAATAFYTVGLLRKAGGGGTLINVGKVCVFGILIAAGLWRLVGSPGAPITEQLRPFFANGAFGLVQAMGFTFIALQGFDLIAAIGGEVKDPARNIPRAMFGSLVIALLIYIPLLLVVATVGVPQGTTVAELGAQRPEAIVAVAAQQFLGGFGFWLVIVAGILSMLSALQANLLAASRVVQSMARDRTLPHWIEVTGQKRGTPHWAVLVTTAIVLLVLLSVKDMATIGAASSLIFLLTFALAHGIAMLAGKRTSDGRRRRVAAASLVTPIIGGIACAALAIFQGVSVPAAGLITCAWLAVGGLLYLSFFARRAQSVDALSLAVDAELVRLRGRSPLVLVPVANPANAEAMVALADALAPPIVGRVLLLTTMLQPQEGDEVGAASLANAQSVLRETLTASFARRLRPELLTTVSASPWEEIVRVARTHRCESLLLGLSDLTNETVRARLEGVVGDVASDVVILRAPHGWRLHDVKRVLVPVAGRGGHDALRARLLGSIHRLGAREVTLLRVLPASATDREFAQARQALARTARDEAPRGCQIIVDRSDDAAGAIAGHAAQSDLVVLGIRRAGKQRKAFGDFAISIADRTSCGIVMISCRD
ncbi:MAG: amino acid permease [Phycisphaeraceae bacterium]|nr:amino acid permease [Phycisphaeraceae bacterium]